MPLAKRVIKATREILEEPVKLAAKKAREVLAAEKETAKPQRPERKIAKSATTRKRVLKKGSDKDIVRAFGKKTAKKST